MAIYGQATAIPQWLPLIVQYASSRTDREELVQYLCETCDRRISAVI
jgi:cell fate (sporulation/competence/biofilm development) regulator YmcA (YheA/YmcA/DUF963 family)